MQSLSTLIRGLSALLLAVLVVSFSARGEESDWPRFRGPAANPVGSNPRLPEQWSTTENVEWSAEIPGRGWSSPIVTGGKVFLTTATTEGKSKPPQVGTEYSNEYVAELLKQGLSEEVAEARVTERDIELPPEVVLHYYLYCLNLETGAVEWRDEYYHGHPPGGRHRKNSFVSQTPVTDGKRVYVYAANLGLYAYDLAGKQLWTTPLEAHPIYLDFGTGASPALHGDQLLILHDNEEQQFIAAFDKMTGERIWRTNRDLRMKGGPQARSGWSTPYVWANDQRTEIVTMGFGAAISYDLEGKELWRLGGMSGMPIPSPFGDEETLFLDAGRGGPLVGVAAGAAGDISLGEGEESNEHVLWSVPRAGTYLPTPVIYEGWMYVLGETGILSRFDAKSGKLSYKSRIDREAGHFTSSPWAYNGKIFCLSEEGDTFVIAAGDALKLLHVNPLGEMAQATPAIAGDRLLVRTENHLYSIRQPGGEAGQ